MRAVPAPVGAVVVDSLPFSQSGTSLQAHALRGSGVDAVALYLGVATAARVAAVVDAGMGVIGVTLAGTHAPSESVAQAATLGLPAGTTLFLDLEGLAAFHTDPIKLAASVNAWADGVAAAGYMPGLYVGAPQPFTSAELHALHVVRYWKGQGRCVDRNGNLAEPTNGWCMTQMWPSADRAGVWSDLNMVGQDYRGRAPAWAST